MVLFGPESESERNAVNFLRLDLHPGILRANVLARRLEAVVRRAGEGIAENLYRRTADALVRHNYDYVVNEDNFARIVRESLQGERLTGGPPPRFPDIGIPEDPRELHKFWSRLSEADKAELYRADPFIGNRDGIPQADRYEYNLETLQTLRDRARNAGDHQRASNYDEIENLVYTQEWDQPSFHLAYIDEKGRFALALDNPDFADNNVILMYPAANNPVKYANETMRQLRQSALLIDPQANTSVTLWGGYDNPRSLAQSIFPQFAEDGAAMARRYHEGLRATHVGPPSHNTTIGHSYGGVLLGHAAGRGATLDTDELVFLGNWGTGVRSVDELSLTGVPPEKTGEHVFATMAPRDSTQLMPETHDKPPTDSEYRASNFSSGSAPTTDDYRGDYPWNPADHRASNYLDSGNPASRNIGLIVTGHGDLVT